MCIKIMVVSALLLTFASFSKAKGNVEYLPPDTPLDFEYALVFYKGDYDSYM